MMIQPDETEIRGAWITRQGKVVADVNCKRIEHLTHGYLKEVARDASGWDVLYTDPADGRYWELIYPESHMHGGGPPTLRQVDREDARRKYSIA